MTPDDGPFILCEDGRAGAGARLFARPFEIIRAETVEEVEDVLERVAGAAARGLHAAGFLTYEAGYALEPRLQPLAAGRTTDLPVAWFGLFADVALLDEHALAAWLPAPAGAFAGPLQPEMSREAYEAKVREIAELIAAGEIYQANLTFPARVRVAGAPLALYAGLSARSRAGWGGVAFAGEHWLLSASPELFFTSEAGKLTARPMKGTAARASDAIADAAAIAALTADPKNRAENLMIVDLTRNDLSRVSVPGSVVVPDLYTVETYPTVHHLTSTVEAKLAPGMGAVDVLRAAFPCGSITGAPKIRAMEAIAALEPGGRGAYTGSMGWIAPNGDAAFNVAIRTLTLRRGAHEAVMGLGAGIVADSRAADEWRECLAKGAFVTAGQPPFDLLETMRFDPSEGIVDLDRHMARLEASAKALGFALNRHDARNSLHAATFRWRAPRAVRLRLSRSGEVAIAVGPPPATPEEPVTVAIRPHPLPPSDFRLAHKTSDRGFWAAARDERAFETVFLDAAGFVTEGSFTQVFAGAADRLVTPPLSRGLLPGVLRARLLAEGLAREGDLEVEDLEAGFWIGNSLRGLIPARLAGL
ncbi:MAG TPA: aminodeoxychorismate synthase component I [Sphingomonadaceae bacterium]|nr:aminodeoxychorismate synthase component I [Sphingomonadaceae bacterium]